MSRDPDKVAARMAAWQKKSDEGDAAIAKGEEALKKSQKLVDDILERKASTLAQQEAMATIQGRIVKKTKKMSELRTIADALYNSMEDEVEKLEAFEKDPKYPLPRGQSRKQYAVTLKENVNTSTVEWKTSDGKLGTLRKEVGTMTKQYAQEGDILTVLLADQRKAESEEPKLPAVAGQTMMNNVIFSVTTTLTCLCFTT
jgi:hypothetical protein